MWITCSCFKTASISVCVLLLEYMEFCQSFLYPCLIGCILLQQSIILGCFPTIFFSFYASSSSHVQACELMVLPYWCSWLRAVKIRIWVLAHSSSKWWFIAGATLFCYRNNPLFSGLEEEIWVDLNLCNICFSLVASCLKQEVSDLPLFFLCKQNWLVSFLNL